LTETQVDAAHYSGASDMISGRMPALVKGAGFAKIGGNEPLQDDGEIFKRSFEAERSLRASVKKSYTDPNAVRKSLNPAFTSQFGMFLTEGANPGYGNLINELNSVLSAELGKNISLGSPLTSGFVPFDLLAPSRLIYPVYSPLRNKVPRVQGQGTSHKAKLVTAIAGSQTGLPSQRISISEFPASQTISGNWPMNLPPAGAQSAIDMSIPYKFFGMSESLSWLAQFAGQGFEDISALANLVLLQEFMLGEEYTLLSGTSAALATPAAPSLTVRTATSTETPLSGLSTNKLYVFVTALNYFGETTVTTTAAEANSAEGNVVDVTITPVNGAYTYNIYIGQAASAQPANSAFFLMATAVGAHTYTLQGAVPTATANPPASDTGTSSTTDYEGWLSVLDGHAGGKAGGAAVYPSGFTGSYINKSVGATLSHTVLFTALSAMWNGAANTGGNTSATGGFRADPSELIVEGSDSARLADEVISAGNATNYRLFLTQNDIGGITSGGAVSEIQNPITRSIVRIVVHPWLAQGTAFLNSYTLPMSWSNVSNVWENVMVQDYLSINWPVIDASFRYSIYMFGALVNYAPQYGGVLQGLQQSVAGTTGTNS
jgi:hypothetical protein